MAGTLICETVTATSMAGLRAARDGVTDADLVELRLDGVADVDVAGALADRTKPVVVTCRPAWEGGRFDGSEEERLGLLAEAGSLGAEFVDIEWRADWQRVAPPRSGERIVSFHDFARVPSDLAATVEAMRQAGSVIKIAVTAERLGDCETLRTALGTGTNHIALAMGSAGWFTRVCPAHFGSRWTYSGAAAPGQLPSRVLRARYGVHRTTAATALYGVVGSPIAHSASPAMHNAAFLAAGLDAVYVPLETADAPDFLSLADAFGFTGLSVTAPHKHAALAMAASAEEVAHRIGAANTLARRADGWVAANFDAAGFLAPLIARDVELTNLRTVVVGAGGAASAAVCALTDAGADVSVAARRRTAAEALASRFRARVDQWPPPARWQLLVNATPVGTWPDVAAAPVALDGIEDGLVYDLVYHPAETTLLRAAKGAGARVIGGLEMLVAQAAAQFEWWTEHPAPVAAMREAADAFVAGHETEKV